MDCDSAVAQTPKISRNPREKNSANFVTLSKSEAGNAPLPTQWLTTKRGEGDCGLTASQWLG